MMIRRILIGLFLGIVVTSCTHNDGYIGPLFGKWQLIEMWENGTMTPHDSLYYNFQSSVIKLQLVHRGGIENATDNYFGSYVREDDILKFKIMEPSWLSINPSICSAVFCFPKVLNLQISDFPIFRILRDLLGI